MDEPFGNHPAFTRWDTAVDVADGHVTFGAAVVPHLLEGIAEFLAQPASRTFKNTRHRVAVGCVPWLNNPDMARLLAHLDAVCLTIDKGAADRRVANLLAARGTGIPASWLGLDDIGVPDADGRPPVVIPHAPAPGTDLTLGPVRTAGYTQRPGGGHPPLLHAKILVLATVDDLDYGEDWDGTYLTPTRVWLGSANWTNAAAYHLEFGLWSADSALIRAALSFATDVIRVSEPLDATTASPTPEYVDAEWDNDAFWQAYQAQRDIAADTDDDQH